MKPANPAFTEALAGNRDDLLLVVRRAETTADEAVAIRDEMRLWAARLLPFLEGDRSISVAEAVRRYRVALARSEFE